MRFIDANALSRAIKTECNPYGKPTIDFESGKKVLKIIDNAPTVHYPNCDICEDKAKQYSLGFQDGYLTGKERPQGEWIDYSNEGYVECPFCGSATNCEDNKDELHYCWNCGADMRPEEETKDDG